MDVDPTELQILKKSQTEQRLHVIMEEIYDKKKDIFRLDRGPFASLKTHIIGGFFEKYLISDKPFHVDATKCVKCGICANVCPVGDILGGFGKMPEWQHTGECLTCFNCYHHCPHHAIEFGNRTKNKGQYYFK
jgi:NAD-dependent dihydropyrimidine dehydrogenase PreA subunit